MTTTTAGQGGAPPLKGSWEARASEARALSLQGRDEAIEKFTFLIERLARMPEAQRLAQDQRLQTILEQSAIGLQSYYARRNRLDDMKTIDDRILGILGDVAQSICRESQARAYWWQGRHQVAAEIVGAEVEKMPFDVDLRWLLFSILIDDEKIDEADAVKVSLLDYLKSQAPTETGDDSDAEDEGSQQEDVEPQARDEKDHPFALHYGLMHYLHANVDMEEGNWEEAVEAFAKAARMSKEYSDRWHLLYRPLVINHQPRLAQRALNRETAPAAQGFWRGLSGYYAGDRQGARVEWQRVTQLSPDKVTLPSVGDWILSHYYLDAIQAHDRAETEGAATPDPDSSASGGGQSQGALSEEGRKGLQVALNLLQQPDTRRDPLVLGLAALGWGMNGHKEHLHRNLRHALDLLRASFQDNKLSIFNWYFFCDLLRPEVFAEVEHYFHKPKVKE
jgi:tetratricopeptide (TPR) repeat protein